MTLLAIAAPGRGQEGAFEPAKGGEVSPAAGSGQLAAIDREFAAWNALALQALAAGPDAGTAGLAAACRAFLVRDLDSALEAARTAAQDPRDEVRRRAEALADLAAVWQQALGRKVSVGLSDKVSLSVPAAHGSWAEEVRGAVLAAVEPCLALFEVEPSLPVGVVFVESVEELAGLTRVPASRLERSGTVGMSAFGHVFLLSPAVFPNGYAWDVVLSHEAAHMAVHLAAPGVLPHALDEGIASFLEGWGNGRRSVDPGPLDRALLQLAADRGLLLEREQLEAPFWEIEGEVQARVARLQARILAQILAQVLAHKQKQGEESALAAFVRTAGGGGDFRKVLKETAGLSPEALFSRARAKWKASGAREHLPLLLAMSGQEYQSEKGRKAVEDGERTVQLGDLLWGRGHIRAAWTVYQRLPQELQASPDATWRICRVLEEQGRLDEALNKAETALALFPDDSRVLHVAARIRLARGETGEAGRLARRAWLVNPFAKETARMIIALPR